MIRVRVVLPGGEQHGAAGARTDCDLDCVAHGVLTGGHAPVGNSEAGHLDRDA